MYKNNHKLEGRISHLQSGCNMNSSEVAVVPVPDQDDSESHIDRIEDIVAEDNVPVEEKVQSEEADNTQRGDKEKAEVPDKPHADGETLKEINKREMDISDEDGHLQELRKAEEADIAADKEREEVRIITNKLIRMIRAMETRFRENLKTFKKQCNYSDSCQINVNERDAIYNEEATLVKVDGGSSEQPSQDVFTSNVMAVFVFMILEKILPESVHLIRDFMAVLFPDVNS